MYKRKITITDESLNLHSDEDKKLLGKVGEEVVAGDISIKEVERLIQKHPNLPELYNYLSVLYSQKNDTKGAAETVKLLVEKFPDYLFGKINLAEIYLQKGQEEKVLEIFKSFDITELYPERKVFHEGEIFHFERVKIRYFLTKKDFKSAAASIDYLRSVNPDNFMIEGLEESFLEKTDQVLADFGKEVIKNKVFGKEYDQKIQTEVKPQFFHEEILELYHYDVEIEPQLLETIINLPRKTLIEDLEKILIDAHVRYKYFRTNEFGAEELFSVFHAFHILAEIESKESLPMVLDFLELNNEFLEFWIGVEFLFHDFWKIIYRLSDENNYDLLFDFLIRPNVDAAAKISVTNALVNVVLHKPKQRDNIVKSFRLTIEYFLKNKDDKDLFDNLFITFMVDNFVLKRLYELLPEIEELYSKGVVVETFTGKIGDVEEQIISSDEIEKQELFSSIFDEYREIIENWEEDPETELSAFLESLSDEKREEFLSLSERQFDEDFDDAFELISDFLDGLDKEQYELFIKYGLSGNEQIDPELEEFLDSLDPKQQMHYIQITKNEDETKLNEELDVFVDSLNEKQRNLFENYFVSIDFDDEEISPELQKFFLSIDEKKREEFVALSEEETDDEEENNRKVDRFVNTLNKKQKRLFLKYVRSISEEDEFHKPVIIKNEKQVGRNDPCPCGSGKKYKKCCMNK